MLTQAGKIQCGTSVCKVYSDNDSWSKVCLRDLNLHSYILFMIKSYFLCELSLFLWRRLLILTSWNPPLSPYFNYLHETENFPSLAHCCPPWGIDFWRRLWERQENLFSCLLVEFFCGELRSRFQITRRFPDSCFTGSTVCQWAKKKKCQIFLWILAQTELIQERFEVILTFKLDIKTVQKYLTSFYIYIPSSFSNILSGLVCHMSDPHCGLHQDHWPPASPLSLPSAPRLGLFFGQRPNVDWLDTCLSKLSAESPHRLLKLWIYLLHISQHHARYSGQEPAIHRGTMNSCFSPVT